MNKTALILLLVFVLPAAAHNMSWDECGTYNISVTGINQNGTTDTISWSVDVVEPPSSHRSSSGGGNSFLYIPIIESATVVDTPIPIETVHLVETSIADNVVSPIGEHPVASDDGTSRTMLWICYLLVVAIVVIFAACLVDYPTLKR